MPDFQESLRFPGFGQPPGYDPGAQKWPGKRATPGPKTIGPGNGPKWIKGLKIKF